MRRSIPLLAALVTMLLAACSTLAPSTSRSAGTPLATVSPSLAVGERVNILIMGIDRRPSERCPCRTDTMMLASVDGKTLSGALLTIPRDLYVPIPGIGDDRINMANRYGDLKKLPGGGPALAKKTVEQALGRPVQYYVLVDFAGFRQIVDQLGGLDIDVPKAIDDPLYPDDTFGYRPLHIPAGRVHMNSEMALAYARTRHADSDFGRMKRQLQVLMAIREKAMQLDTLPRLPGLTRTLSSVIQTDMPPQDAFALALIGSLVGTDNIQSASIDNTMTTDFRTSTGAAVLRPDRVKIGQLVDQLMPR